MAKKKEEDDIAPVRLDFFQKGAFEDGYQLGDVTKAILGTAADVGVGAVKGASKLVGGILDLGAYGVAGVADLVGEDDFAGRLRVKAQENTIDNAFKGTDDWLNQYSLLGRTSDSISEGLGQVAGVILTGGLGASAGLGAAGATALTTGVMGLSSFGSGMSEAYSSGATDEGAATYGLIKGVVDAGSELIFGGLGKTVKAVGLSKGLSSLDDMFAQKLSSRITNQTAKNFVEYGVKASAEGVEEVLAGIGSIAAKKLTYMSDKELSQLIEDEDLLEQFVVGAVTSGIAQSGIVPGMKRGSLQESNATGRDFITGFNESEQKVVDTVYENMTKEAEKDGKTLSKKDKQALYDKVLSMVDEGEIEIDTIEEILGGDSYTAYKKMTDKETAVLQELSELYEGEELQQQVNDFLKKAESNALKTKLTTDVYSLVKGGKLQESYLERGRRKQKYEADVTKYDEKQRATVQKAIESGVLNNTRKTHKFVDLIAKISADKGVVFDFANNKKLQGTQFAVDGRTVDGFVTKDGITLNMDSPKAWKATVGHAITHVLEGTELYSELQNILFDFAKSRNASDSNFKNEYQERLYNARQLYKDLDGYQGVNGFEAIKKEVAANLVGDYLFADESFIQHLSTSNKRLFRKVYDEVKYLLKVATAGSEEAKQLEKIRHAFENAYRDEVTKKDGTQYAIEHIDNRYMPVIDTKNDTKELKAAEKYLETLVDTEKPFSTILYDAQVALRDLRYQEEIAPVQETDQNYQDKAKDGTQLSASGKITNKLTGEEISENTYAVLDRLKSGETVTAEELDALKEVQEGNKRKSELLREFISQHKELQNIPETKVGTHLLNSQERQELREKIISDRLQEGSYSGIDSDGNEEYNGSVEKGKRLDIVIGLPASGKSSAVANPLSQQHHSMIIDSDIIKSRLPEYQGGWGASLVHEESSIINADIFDMALADGNNIVLPIVGAKASSVERYIAQAKRYGYGVNLHLNEIPSSKAVGRLLIRYFNTGRFLDPSIVANYGNKPAEVYEKLKNGSDIDGYSSWNNDVEYGQNPIQRDASENESIRSGGLRGSGRDGRENVGRNAETPNQTSEPENLIAPIKETSSKDGVFFDAGDMSPSAPALQAEVERLEAEKADLEARMTELLNAEDYEAAEQLNEEWYGIQDRINAMQGEMDSLTSESESVEVEDPFENRDWYDVGNRKVKAYMYANPEVKPFFQEEAAVMLDELNNTVKVERWYNDHLYYETNGERGFGGNSRLTSDSIAEMLDEWGMSYADIEKGLKAILEDHGAENIAAAKKIEFMLNRRLMDGYKGFGFGYDGFVAPNQDYLRLLEEKQITEYSGESFAELTGNADIAPIYGDMPNGQRTMPRTPAGTPIGGDIAPTQQEVKNKKTGEIKGQQALTREDATKNEDKGVANVLVEEPKVNKDKPSAWSKFKNLVLDKGMVFEDLSLATGNRELQARWNSIRYAKNKAQRLMESGNASTGISSLDSIRKAVEGSGKTQQFYEYMYHMLNTDRMTLEDRYDNVFNKAVFGDSVTADISREAVGRLENENPEFKKWAQEVYDYMSYLRQEMVDAGVISEDVAKLWAEMYPHYVPIRRAGDTGLSIHVPLDTRRTGVNAPIKGAVGGSRDILPLFETIGQRTMQTYNAIAKNRFGVELKNTLGTTIENEIMRVDDAIDGIDRQDGMLQNGKNGKKPTFTVFENGKKVTFEITPEMYDAIKPTSDALSYTSKVATAASNIRRGTLTEYNPWFLLKNAVKDVQDVLINSQHATRTYLTIPKAINEILTKGRWYTEYLENGGDQNSYFDSQANTFNEKNKTVELLKTVTGLNAISKANNIIERLPRLAEYIASRESGRSVDVSMLDAARVTTNFAAGGDLTKFLNRNGSTFLNASVQGAMQQVRNIREAKMNGLKGWASLAGKFAVAGIPALVLNNLIWGDDDEYEELSDYVKQDYYIVGKYGDGQFVRIPKGRTVAVIQNAFEQMQNLITGEDEADLGAFVDLVISNLAPNNPIDNNILSPIIQVAQNKTWYGEDLVPTRLQDLPNAEQYDESTDSISRWLGETFNVSPYKANYLIDQYSGVLGDTFLPMLTPEAESGNDTLGGKLLAPLKDMFTTDSVLNNQNVSDFYDMKDELAKNANSMYATDEDILMAKYMNSVNSEMGALYAEKREIQNSNLSDARKYELVREIQQEIDRLAEESLNTYENVNVSDVYATVGDRHYRWYEPSGDSDAEPGWQKITDKQLAKQEEVTSTLGITPSEYWSKKEEYDYAYDYPGKYALAKSVGGYTTYKTYTKELYDIKADKDKSGNSISGSRKAKVLKYINRLDASYYEKLILFKSQYHSDDTYNHAIINYLNSREDISYKEMEAVLKELGFAVSANGNITWD